MSNGLSKVTQYVKNVGRSVKYSAVDIGKDVAPSTSEFVETNSELFKDINYVIRNRRMMVNRVSSLMQKSRVYEAGDVAIKSIFEDIKSGNFYNKERSDELNKKAFGFDGFDDVDSESISWDDDETEESELSQTSKASATAVSDTIARSSEYIVKTQRANSEYAMMQNINNFNTVNHNLQNINSNIGKVLEFGTQGLKTHIDNSKKFYEEVTPAIKEMSALLKESTEMNRNTYKSTRQASSSTKKIGYDDIVTSSGMPDIKEYINSVMQNSKSSLGSMAGIGDMFGEDSNILLTFAAAPLQFLPKAILEKVIDKKFKQSISKLDKSASGVFSNLMSRLNDLKYSDNKILSTAGDIFGVKNDLNTSVDTSNYEKGAMKWNGKANQALVEVLPQQLSKIISIMSGTPETIYDYDKGTFIAARSVKTEYDNKIDSSYKNSTSDMRKEFDSMLEMYTFENLENKKNFQKDMDSFFKYFFTSGRHFDPNNDIGSYEDLGIASDSYDKLRGMFKNSNRSTQMTFDKNIMEGRDSLSKSFASENEKGDSIYRVLNNGFDVNQFFDDKGDKNSTLKDVSSPLISSKDSFGNNIFFYLNKITSTLLDGIKVYDMNSSSSKSTTSGRSMKSNSGNSDDVSKILNRDTSLYNVTESGRYNPEDITTSMRDSEVRRAERNNIDKKFDEMDSNTFVADLKGQLHDKQLIKERKDYHENNKPKDSWIDDIIGTSLSEKIQTMGNSFKEFTNQPWDLVTKVTDRIDLRLYEIMFGREDKYYKGKEVKGFMDMIMVDLQNTFETFNTWLDDSILKPLSGKIKGIDNEFLNNILKGVGIDIKGEEIGKKLNNFIYGEKDEDGNYVSTGAISDIVNQTKNDFAGLKQGVIGAPGPIRKIIKLITAYCYDLSKHNEADSMVILDQIYEEINKFYPKNNKDISTKKRIIQIINDVEDPDKTLRNVLTELKRAGYANTDNLIGMFKNVKDEVIDYTFGSKNAFDKIEKIMYQSKLDGNKDLGRSKEVDSSKFMELHRILYKTMGKYKNSNKSPSINQLIDLVKNLLTELNNIEVDNIKEKNIKVKLFNTLKSGTTVKSIQSSISKFTKELSKILSNEAGGLLTDLLNNLSFFNDSNVNDKLQDGLNEYVQSMNNASSIINNVNTPFMTANPVLNEYGELNTNQFEFKSPFQRGLEDRSDVDVKQDKPVNPLSVFNMGNTSPNTILEQMIMEMKNLPRHAEGLDYVPRDEYATLLHKGERVLTEEETKQQDMILPEILQIVEDMSKSVKNLNMPSDEEYNSRLLSLVRNQVKDMNPTSDQEGVSKNNTLKILDDKEISDEKKIDEIMKLSNEDVAKRGPINESLATRMAFEVRSMLSQTRNILFGTTSEDEEEVEKVVNTNIEKVTKDITSNFREYLPKMGSGMLLGGGLGLVGGLVGGPLVWGTMGAGLGLLRSSSSVQEAMFGDIGKDGKRSGGLISKNFIDGFDKYSNSMKVNAIGGAALGLMSFTPFGLMGGILGGSALGFLKKNETAQNILFGESGILGPKVKNRLDSMMPKVALGMIGGVALGPFGLVGNMMLGSGVGMLASSNKFQDMLFGKEDKDGKRSGGVVSWVKEQALSSVYFLHHNLAKPIMKTLAPLRKEVGLIARSIKDGIISSIDKVFETFVGKPLGTFMEKYILKPAAMAFGGFFKGLKFGLRNLIATPGKLIGFVGDELRLKHVRQGEASYMSDEEKQSVLDRADNSIDGLNRFRKTMFSKTNRYKNSTEEEQDEAFWWRKKKKKSSEKDSGDEVKDEIKLTNTTLSELLGYVRDISVHMNNKTSEYLDIKNKQKTNKSDVDNIPQQADDAIKNAKDQTASLLTPKGEIKYERDYKGELIPKKGKAINSINTEEKNDNSDMDRLIDISEESLEQNRESGKKLNIFNKAGLKLGGIFETLMKFAPMLLMAAPLIPTMFNLGGKLLSFLSKNGIGKSGNAEEGDMEGGGVFDGVSEGLSGLQKNGKKNALNMLMWGKNPLSKTARFLGKPLIATGDTLVKKGFNIGKNVAKGAVLRIPGVNNVAKKVIKPAATAVIKNSESLLTRAFSIFRNPRIQKIIGKELAESILKMPQVIIKKAGPEIATKIGANIAKMFTGPLFIAIVIADILWGMDHADEILHIQGSVPFRVRAIAGIIHALNQRFTFGLVPEEFMLVNVLKHVGTKSMNDAVAEGQALLKNHYNEYMKNNPNSSMSLDEYKENYNDTKASTFKWYNPFTWGKGSSNKTTPSYGMGSGPKFGLGLWDRLTDKKTRQEAANRKMQNSGNSNVDLIAKLTDKSTREAAATRYLNNKGNAGSKVSLVSSRSKMATTTPFYSQRNNKWGYKLYNTSKDTKKQTIADSGCGPTAAAMVTSGITGSKITPDVAASFAIKNKLKEKNGGTLPEFFKRFNEQYSIPTSINKLDGKVTKGSKGINIINTLKKKQPVILMGKSSTSKGKTPFGKSPHYVVALGIDNGKLVVHDPEQLSGNRVYDLNSTIKQSTYGIVSSTPKGYAKLADSSNGEEDGTEEFTSTPEQEEEAKLNPIEALIKAGSLMVKSLLGFSDEEDSSGGEAGSYDFSNLPANKVAFVKRLIPGAVSMYKSTGLLPSLSLAQACLESSWGTSGLSKTANNLFGIKTGSGWTGKSTKMSTKEDDGSGKKYTIKAGFRVYNSIEDSQADYFRVLKNSRYDRVRQAKDYKTAAKMVKKCGYATDSSYDKKLISIIEKYKFHTIDNGGAWDASGTGVSGSGDANKAVAAIKSRIGKNKYTQSILRTKVGSGYGDCSSTVQWAYKQAGVKIGGNTAAQVKQGKIVDRGPIMHDKMNVKNLRPGDLLFYKNKKYKPSSARPWGVGHVEMYTGNNQLVGHGSGIGPTVKDVTKYRRNEYILARRLSSSNPKFGMGSGPNIKEPAKTKSIFKIPTSSNPKFGMGSGSNIKEPAKTKSIFKIPTSTTPKFGMGSGIKEPAKAKSIFKIPTSTTPKFGMGINIPKISIPKINKTKNDSLKNINEIRLNTPKTDNYSQNISKETTSIPKMINTSMHKIMSKTNKIASTKILEVFINLLKHIVENTNNLSQIVTLLSKGLNINIPDEIINKAVDKKIPNINLTQMIQDVNRNNTNSSELLNLVNMIEEMVIQ